MACPLFAAPAGVVTIRQVGVLGSGNSVEVEIVASGPVAPQTLAVTGPDRIVIDLPNALPAPTLHRLAVNRGQVKGVRTGLFSANPPVTRVVLDLNKAQAYQVFSTGNRVIVKLNESPGGSGRFETQFEVVNGPAVSPAATVPGAVNASSPVPVPRNVEVQFQDGQLRIWADKVTLAELLKEVRRKTGADIPIPAGTDQELVVADLGPAPARDVLASLLNGSRFNFIMVGSDADPNQLHSVILTPRPGTAIPRAMNYQPSDPRQAVATIPAEPVPESRDEQPDTDEAPGPDSSNQKPN
ncbi:MAG TPA: AMIN domain-containing protein [Terriglobales bacterium]|nr:AMIN domain-containing protein [Terriglobales bacterium]